MINPEIAHVFNDDALNEIRKMRRRIGAKGTDRMLLAQMKLLDENKTEISQLRWVVGALQDRLMWALEQNKKYKYDETLRWGLDNVMKDVGSPYDV